MHTKFDPTKPVQTRDGRPAKILSTNFRAGGNYPIVAEINGDYSDSFTPTGQRLSDRVTEDDLVNVPARQTRWINIYPDSGFDLRDEADKHAGATRIACVLLTFTEGQGL